MFKNIVKNYINNMSINDVIMLSKKENIELDECEYLKIFNLIKKYGEKLIYDSTLVKNLLDSNFNDEKSQKIYDVFLKYQKKYSSYL